MKITKSYAENDFNKLKSCIKKEINRNNFVSAFNLIQCCSGIAYHLNFKYTDDDLENYLYQLSEKLVSNTSFIPIEEKWIFYDSFALDNRGLTQQYLSALDQWGVEYLYILEKPHDMNNCKNILEQVNSNPKAEIYIIETISDAVPFSSINEFSKIQKVIDEYKPKNVFLHIAPWSVFAITVWSKYENIVNRYLINLTDHSFWLGTNCLDYCIEFRDYGCNISNKFRYIKSNKIIKQLYFPIISSSEFQGFPEIDEQKVIIFTGGSYYKMYGEDFLFLNILKGIVEKNQNVIILIAGGGDDSPLKNFISEYKLEKNILIIGNRIDISEVFKRIDIYLNTYPLIGGLMSQYAIMNNKPLIGFNSLDIPCNNSESLFENAKLRFTYFDIDEFYLELDKLINSIEYRNEFVSNYTNLIPDKNEFSFELQSKIFQKRYFAYENIEIDTDRFCEIYCDMENNYLKQYDLIKFRWLGLKYFKYDFFNAFVTAIRILINKRQLLIIKIMKKIGIK